MRRFVVALVAGLAACVWSSATLAGSGVAGYYSTYANWQDQGEPYNYLTINNGAPFYATSSANSGQASASLTISANPANGNVGLHGSEGAGFTYIPGFEAPGNAGGGFDLYYYDTFHIDGPAGSPEQFQFSLTLNGSASANTDGDPLATSAYGAIVLLADANWIEPGSVVPGPSCLYGFGPNGNPCGEVAAIYLSPSSPSQQTVTGTIALMGGTSIQLGEDLWSRAFASQATDASAEFNAADTGFFTLTPLTPGASFTTDSGLTYSASPELSSAVPEPATWTMLILGVAMIGFAARRRNEGMALAA